MKVRTDPSGLRRTGRPVVLAAGFFDGLHRGHCRLITLAMEEAARCAGRAWVLTFDRHPLTAIRPKAAPPRLTSNAHKIRILRRLGVDGCLLIPFTRRLAALEPEAFVHGLHSDVPGLHEVLVGRNWRFGRQGRGSPAMLSRMGSALGFRVRVIRPVTRGGLPVSSTRIRTAVLEGDLAEAEAMLGRPFSTLGTVTRGRALGRELGFPTANLDVHDEVLPPTGVYAVRATLRRRMLPGILNLGFRPTVERRPAGKPVPELHLLDLNADLYGQEIEVSFASRLRDEKRFPSTEALRKQICRDVRAARELLH